MDLAIASLSLDWNFGEGHREDLFEAYGIDADEERIRLLPRALGARVMTHTATHQPGDDVEDAVGR